MINMATEDQIKGLCFRMVNPIQSGIPQTALHVCALNPYSFSINFLLFHRYQLQPLTSYLSTTRPWIYWTWWSNWRWNPTLGQTNTLVTCADCLITGFPPYPTVKTVPKISVRLASNGIVEWRPSQPTRSSRLPSTPQRTSPVPSSARNTRYPSSMSARSVSAYSAQSVLSSSAWTMSSKNWLLLLVIITIYSNTHYISNNSVFDTSYPSFIPVQNVRHIISNLNNMCPQEI